MKVKLCNGLNSTAIKNHLFLFKCNFNFSYSGMKLIDIISKSSASKVTTIYPKNTIEIQEIINFCITNRIKLSLKYYEDQNNSNEISNESNTIKEKQIIINTKDMNSIISTNIEMDTITVQSGYTFDKLDSKLPKIPIIKYINEFYRYKNNIYNLSFIRGIKVVTYNGEILDLTNSLPKNNTGYDLKQMFFSTNGKNGIITESVIDKSSLEKLVFEEKYKHDNNVYSIEESKDLNSFNVEKYMSKINQIYDPYNIFINQF